MLFIPECNCSHTLRKRTTSHPCESVKNNLLLKQERILLKGQEGLEGVLIRCKKENEPFRGFSSVEESGISCHKIRRQVAFLALF
jgi:hypothetical protein